MTGERRIEPFPFIDMVGARGVKIDLLQEVHVRRLFLHARGDFRLRARKSLRHAAAQPEEAIELCVFVHQLHIALAGGD